MWPNKLGLDVSRESLEKLKVYHALLLKWQKAINLVSSKTVHEAWVRHFADSVQVEQFIPEGTKTMMDVGSGAGFPGAVLAILRPEIEVHVVESDERKCQFMRTVSRETDASIRIHTSRIESLNPQEIRPDVVTARALAPLGALLDYMAPFVVENPELKMVFLKGERAQEEIDLARGRYDFQVESHRSCTDSGAYVLRVSDVRKGVC